LKRSGEQTLVTQRPSQKTPHSRGKTKTVPLRGDLVTEVEKKTLVLQGGTIHLQKKHKGGNHGSRPPK